MKPLVKAWMTVSSCCFSMMPGVVEKTRKAISRLPASGARLSWKRVPRSSGHESSKASSQPAVRFSPLPFSKPVGRTVICVLARHFGNGITNLVAHGPVGLDGERLEQTGAYDGSLVLCKRDKEVDVLVLAVLTRLGRYAPEENGGKGTELRSDALQCVSGDVYRHARRHFGPHETVRPRARAGCWDIQNCRSLRTAARPGP